MHLFSALPLELSHPLPTSKRFETTILRVGTVHCPQFCRHLFAVLVAAKSEERAHVCAKKYWFENRAVECTPHKDRHQEDSGSTYGLPPKYRLPYDGLGSDQFWIMSYHSRTCAWGCASCSRCLPSWLGQFSSPPFCCLCLQFSECLAIEQPRYCKFSLEHCCHLLCFFDEFLSFETPVWCLPREDKAWSLPVQNEAVSVR